MPPPSPRPSPPKGGEREVAAHNPLDSCYSNRTMSPNRRGTGVGRATCRLLSCLMLASAIAAGPPGAHAQWQTQTEGDKAGQPQPAPPMPGLILAPAPELRPSAPPFVPPNTTVV